MSLFKSVVLVTSLLSATLAKAETVEDLSINCLGGGHITEIKGVYFNPAKPGQHRVGPRPANGFLDVSFKVAKFNTVGCSLLQSKYKLDLSGELKATVALSFEPADKEAVEFVAQAVLGDYVGFKVQQKFGYTNQWSQGHLTYLPLFPDVVAETLEIKGNVEGNGFVHPVTIPLEISVPEVYGTTDVKTWSDEEKLELANKLIYQMGDLGKSSSLTDFDDLFLGLGLESNSTKHAHFLQNFKILNTVKSKNPHSGFFDFQTGGTGAFVGAPFAKKIVKLANQVASTSEKIQLAYEHPTIFIADWGWKTENCLDIDSDDFGVILEKWKTFLPTKSLGEAGLIKKMVKGFLNSNSGNYSCMHSFNTETNIALANSILK